MEPIYAKSGAVVGWLHQLRVIDRYNNYRGFLHDNALYSMNGQYLGRFNNGFFRDSSGNAVAFIKGASGGPLLPLTQIPPIPPINPIPPIPPIPPIDSLIWGVEWENLLN